MSDTPQKLPVVYACSGCSDVGALADQVARQLDKSGDARMSCLAGIGGRVPRMLAIAREAPQILVIDGCPLECAKKTLQRAGFETFQHLGLHEAGLHKGRLAASETEVAEGVAAARARLSG